MDVNVDHSGGIFIVRLSGRINPEAADQFKSSCVNLLKDKKIIFDLKDLSFVGSSGITSLVEAITELSSHSPCRLCHASNEFKRIFETRKIDGLTIHDDRQAATLSFIE